MTESKTPPTQVPDKPVRRQFTPEYKLRILQEIDTRREEGRGVIGQILRREGLFASQAATWRQELEGVIANGLPARKRGRKPDPTTTLRKEKEKLERRNAWLEEELRQARLIIGAQKKIAEMFKERPQSDEPSGEGE